MKSRLFAAALAAGVAVVGWGQSADAAVVDLVVNGEFNDPFCAGPWCAINPGDVPGWNTTDSAIEFWPQGFLSSPTVGTDGLSTGQHLEINTHASRTIITQEIFVPLDIDTGVEAQFSFDAWSRNGGTGLSSVNGSESGELISTTAIALNGSVWTENSETFSLIAGETVTLSFQTVTGNSWKTPHIDQVSLLISTLPEVVTFELPVPANDLPEPATLALFGFGLAGLGAASRRRRRG